MASTTHKGAKRLAFRSAGFALSALLLAGCDPAAESTAPELLALSDISLSQTKVDVCHRNADETYVKISISEAAYETHIEHGDQNASSGGLDAECQPQPCPCYSATSVADDIASWPSDVEVAFTDQTSGDYYYTAIRQVQNDFKSVTSKETHSASHAEDPLFASESLYFCSSEASGRIDASQSEIDACRAILLEYATE